MSDKKIVINLGENNTPKDNGKIKIDSSQINQNTFGTDRTSLLPSKLGEYQLDSKYDGGITPGSDLENFRASKQSAWSKWANGGLKAISTVGTSLGEGIGVLAGLGQYGADKLTSNADTDTIFKNPVVNFFSGLQDNINKSLPNYYSQEEKRDDVISNLATHNFWSDKFLNGVGFAASSLIPSMAISKAGNAFKLAVLTTKAGKASKFAGLLGENVGAFERAVDGLSTLNAAMIGRIGESGIEANGAYDEVYNDLISKGASHEEADKLAKDARLKTFGTNMLLAIPDAIQFAKLFGNFKNSSKVLNKSIKDKAIDALEVSLTEAAEENLQLAITNSVKKLANKDYALNTKSTTEDFLNSIGDEFIHNFTTKEGQESMLLGGLVGSGMTAASNLSNSDPKVQTAKDNLNAFTHLEGLKTKSVIKGDIGTYKAAQDMQFNSWVKSKIDSNQFDDFTTELEAWGNMNKEELPELGVLENETDSFGIDKDPKKIADKAIKRARELKKINDNIDLSFPNVSEKTKNNLFYNLSAQDYITKKLDTLQKDLDKEDAKKLRSEQRGEAYVEPVEITKIRNDYDQLKSAKSDLVNDYKKLIDPTEQKKAKEKEEKEILTPKQEENKVDNEIKNQASDFVKNNREDINSVSELDQALSKLDPKVKEAVLKNYKGLVSQAIANDETLPTLEDDVDGRFRIGKEIPSHLKIFGENTHIDSERGVSYIPTPTNIPEAKETKKVETPKEVVPFNAVKSIPASDNKNDSVNSINTEFKNHIRSINGEDYVIVELDPNGHTPIINNFDKEVFKIDFNLLATPDAINSGDIATLELLDTNNVEFVPGKKHGKDSIVIKVGDSIIGKLSNRKHFDVIKKAIIDNNGKLQVKLNGRWGSIAIRTSKTNTSLNDIKTLSERNLPDGKIIICTVKDDVIVFPDNIRRENKDFTIKNKVNGKHFLLLKTPEGNLYPDMLWNTPVKDIKIGDKTISSIILSKLKEFKRDVLDTIPLSDTSKELENTRAKWVSFRKENIDPITNYSIDGYNLGLSIDKDTKEYKIILNKGNKTEKQYVTGKEIIQDIENRFFNINSDLLKANSPFTFEGVDYSTYTDFLVDNNIVTTSLYPSRPFGFTNVEVDISNLLNPITEVKTEEPFKPFEVEEKKEVPPITNTDKSKAREKLNKLKNGNSNTLNRVVDPNIIYQTWDKEKELQWMSENLPQIPIEIATSTRAIYDNFGVEAHGVFTNAVIHLANNAEIGTSYHEAFHAVFNLYLTPTQREEFLKQTEGETDLIKEEKLAEEFRNYVLTDGFIKPKNNSLSKFFNDILLWIKNKLGLLQLNDLYQMINSGKFANANPIKNPSLEMKMRIIDGFSAVEQKNRIDVLVKQLFDELTELQNVGNILSIDFSIITNEQLEQSFNNIKEVWELEFEDTKNPKVAKLLNNFEEFKLLTTRELSKYNINIKDEKERIYEQAAFETSQKDNVAKEVKLYLATLPQVDVNDDNLSRALKGDFDYVKDDLGFTKFSDFNTIYNYLSQSLIGFETIEDMINELENLALVKPDLHRIIYDLKKTPSQENKSDINAENFRHKFFNTFSNQYVDFLTLAKDLSKVKGESNSNTYEYKVYETNKKSLQRQIVNDWIQNYNTLKSEGKLPSDKKTYEEFRTLVDKTYNKQLNTPKNYEGLKEIAKLLNQIGINVSEAALVLMKQSFYKDGTTEDFTNYIGKTNSASIAQILKQHHEANIDIYSGFKGEENKGERKAVNNLAAFEKLVYVDIVNASFLNGQNKTVYAINSNHYASKFVNRLKDNDNDIINKLLSIPYFANCKILKDINSNNNLRDEFKLYVFDTIFDNNNKFEGTSYDELDSLQAVTTRLNMFFNRGNKFGYFHTPTPSDRGNIQAFKLIKLNEKDNEVIFNLDGLLNKNSKFYTWLLGSIIDEYNRIKQTNNWDGQDPIKNYHVGKNGKGSAYYFNQFWELNKFLDLENTYKNNRVLRDLDVNDPEFHQYISNSFKDQFTAEKNKLSEIGLISYDEKTNTVLAKDKSNIKLLDNNFKLDTLSIDNYIANYIYANTETTKLLSGDLAFYKGNALTAESRAEQIADANKRFGQSFVPGRDISISTEKYQGGAREKFNLAISQDNELASDYIINYAKAIYNSLDSEDRVDFNTLFSNEKRDYTPTEIYLKELLGGYMKNNQTDAQGYITLDRLRNIMEGQGAFTGKFKEAWNRLNEGGSDFSDFQTVFQPIKGFYYNQEFKQGLAVPTQVKYSTVPLVPAFVKNYPILQNLLDKMTEGKIDEFVFESGIKAGLQKKNSLESINTNEPLQYITLDNRNWRIPQVVPYKSKTKENFGSQIRKLITGNLDLNGIYNINGNNYTGKSLKETYQNLIKDNIKEGYDNLIPRFENKESVSEMVLAELKASSRRSLPDLYEKALTYIKDLGDTRVSMDFPLIKRKIENILNSMFDKKVIKQDLPGFAAVQVSSFGVANSSKDLNFVRLEDGIVKPAEVIVSPQYFLNSLKKKGIDVSKVDINNIPEELKKLVIYRIPTQGKNSMLPAYIKGFLPAEVGSQIILPFEVTTQAGSDYDIDKVYIEMYNFKIDDGTFSKIKDDTLAGRQNEIIDIHYGILSDPKHFSELITPNNSNTLKKLKDEIFENDKVVKFWHNLWIQEDLRSKNQAGKQLVGVYSIQSTAHSIAQDIDMKLSEVVKFEGKEEDNLSNIKNIYDKLISDDLSERQTAAVDNAKEPILGYLNDNKFTSGVISLIIRTGYGNEIPSYFVTQPIIKFLTKEYSKLASDTSPEKALKKALEITETYFAINVEKDPNKIKVENLNLSYLKEHISNTKKGENHHKIILEAFIKYKEIGDTLSRVSNALAIDTKGVEATISENIANLNNLEDAKSNKYISFNIDKYNSHSLHSYENYGIKGATENIKRYMPLDSSILMIGTEDYKGILTRLEELKGDNLSPDEIQKVIYDFYTYLHTHPDSNYSKITDNYKRQLFTGEGRKDGLSLAKRLQAYAKINESNLNPFVKALKVEIKNKETGFDLVKYNNTGALSSEEKTDLSNSFYDLVNGTEEEYKLAKDLSIYSFITYGFNRGVDTFIDLIPIEIFEQQGITEFYRNIKKYFDNPTLGGKDEFNTTNFINQYIQNNYKELSFVQKINNKTFEELKQAEVKPAIVYVIGVNNLYSLIDDKYVEINTLGSPKLIKEYSLVNSNLQSIINTNNVKKQKKSIGTEVSTIVLTNILDKLSSRFGIKYNLVNNPLLDYAGKFEKGEVTINVANVGLDTPFHEFAHPFIELVKSENPVLYRNLSNQIQSTKDGIKILNKVNRLYPELSDSEVIEEAIVQSIGEYAANNINPETGKSLISAIRRLIERLGEYINKLFDKNFTIQASNLNPNTTLEQLGQYISTGNSKIETKRSISDISNEFNLINSKGGYTQIKTSPAIIKQQIESKYPYIKVRTVKDGNGYIIQLQEKPKYQKSDKLSKTIDKIRDILNRQIAIYSNRDVNTKTKAIEKLNTLLSNITDLNGIEGINLFVNEAKEYTEKAGDKINEILEGNLDRHDSIKGLVEIYEYINSYDVLDDIKNLPEFKLRNKGEGEVLTKLREAIERRDEIKADYFEYGVPLLADWLLSYNTGTVNSKAEEISPELKLTRDKLISELREASKDISKINSLLDPIISSEDSALALFAKAVKRQIEEARQKDISFEHKIGKALNKFKENKSANSVAEFYKDLYEEIEVLGEGNVLNKKVAFVQKDDVTAFNKSKQALYERIGKRPDTEIELKKWKKEVFKWYQENTIVDEEGKTIPNEKYLNPKWVALQKNKPALELYNFLLNSYLEDQEKLPKGHRRGYILPSIRKDSRDRLQEQGVLATVKDVAKDAFTLQATDTQYGIQTQSGEQHMSVPIFYTNNLDAKDTSVDLASSIMQFKSMVNRFTSLSEISSEVNLMKDIISNRKVRKTNSKGENVIDALSKKIGVDNYLKKEGDSNSYNRLKNFIEMVYYGQQQAKEEIWGYDITKGVNTLSKITSMTALAGNLLQGVSNVTLGNVLTYAEGAGGQWFNRTNWKNGNAKYWSTLHEVMGDIGKLTDKSKTTQLIELFDAIQGEYSNSYGKNVSGSIAKKLFTTDTAFFLQHAGEHQIQVSTLFALMDATKVKDASGKEISLYDAFEKDSNGVLKLKDGVKFTKEQEENFRNRLHGINKRLHGVYNSFDRAVVQRYTLGRLGLLFRNWIKSGFERRFQATKADFELDDIVEGNYRTFWKALRNNTLDLGKFISFQENNLTEFQKQNIKRTLVEINALLASIVIFGLLSKGDDDENKNNWAENFIAYQARRLQAELLFYTNPKDAFRVLQTPTATMSQIEQTARFMDQLLFTWNPDKLVYQRKSGIHEKGDNKSIAYFKKIIPVLGKIEAAATPEEGIKFFNK